MQINVQIKDFAKYERTLNNLHRSAFPVAIRETLNEAAFYQKKMTLPKSWDDNFIVRHKTFLKSHSGVRKSVNTFEIDRMQSKVGTLDKDLAGKQLSLHETGGNINNRAYQKNAARVGGSINNRVRRVLRYKRFNAKKTPGAYIMSTRERGVIIRSKGGAILHFKGGDKNNWKNWKTLYTQKDTVKLKKESFNVPAAKMTQIVIPKLFYREFSKRLKKYTK